MVKVRILTGVTAASAAALIIPSLTGCTADAADTNDDVGASTDNNTESIAGSGVLALHGWSLNYSSTSGGDEFLRVGERLKVSVDFHNIVYQIAYSDTALQQELNADPNKVKLTAKLQYTKTDESRVDASAPVTWGAGPSNTTVGTSGELVIPKGIKKLKLEVVAEYSKNGQPQTKEILGSNGIQSEFVVFGAFTPNKLALFDTMGAERRTRVVEGGGAVKGANLLVSVTDWRLDTVVDKSSLDLRVGDQQSGGRFGPTIVPAYGQLEYEVEAVVSTDDGQTYQPLGLSKAMKPDVLARADGWRFAFQGSKPIPADAGAKLKIAFHVKAFLVVPQFGILNGRYAPGSRILLKDVWDNNGGQDYSLPITQQ